MDCTKLLEQVEDRAENIIKDVLNKGNRISATDLEHLTKAVCLIDMISSMNTVDEGNSYGHSTRRYYDGKMSRKSGNGYSGHSLQDRMIAKLEEMYAEAQNDHEEKVITEWIKRLTY